MESYIEARQLFTKWCANINGAVPVEFGTIGCPGVSDIDIGIVFGKEFDMCGQEFNRYLGEFPQKTREMMNGGTLMLFPEDAFKNILLIDDIRIKSLVGTVSVEENTSKEKELVDLVQIIEWLPERVSRIYTELKKKNADNRRLMGLFYSMCYSLEKIQKYTKKTKCVSDFIGQAHNTRKNWFLLGPEQLKFQLDKMSDSYFGVVSGAVGDIVPVLENHFNICCRECSNINYNINNNINLIPNDNIEITENNDEVYVGVPLVFLCTYLEYSKHNSKLCDIIRGRLACDGISVLPSSEINNILERRAKIFSKMFDFIKDLGCRSGLYKFGWYLND